MSTPWSCTVLTLFPEIYPGPLAFSLAGKALQEGIWNLDAVNIRDFAHDKHRHVDDICFGGGVGMVIRPDVVDQAIRSVREKCVSTPQIIYFTPRGKPFTQKRAHEIVQDRFPTILLCGRYEGVDERVIEAWNMEEISIGDYVLSCGDMAALTFLDVCVRLLPGVVGKETSLTEESFELDLLEYPQYTRPQVWNEREVPSVLLSGHHAKIRTWRRMQAEAITKLRRPDLWEVYCAKNRRNEK